MFNNNNKEANELKVELATIATKLDNVNYKLDGSAEDIKELHTQVTNLTKVSLESSSMKNDIEENKELASKLEKRMVRMENTLLLYQDRTDRFNKLYNMALGSVVAILVPFIIHNTLFKQDATTPTPSIANTIPTSTAKSKVPYPGRVKSSL